MISVKQLLSKAVLTRTLYERARSLFHRTRKLRFYAYDIIGTYKDMRWDGPTKHNYWTMSSELLFHYHKLEKGLCMPGEKRLFGYDPASTTLLLLKNWRNLGLSSNDSVYLGAVEALRSYRNRLNELPQSKTAELEFKLDAELALHPQIWASFETPQRVPLHANEGELSVLWSLAKRRRSVRCFSDEKVAVSQVQEAVAIAQMSPSACNRQPNKVHIFNNKLDIDALLSLQNGNRGFGHTIPTLLVLTSDANGFFDASERHQPYVDGGLFAMSLLQALQALGVSSCCLNWCVEPVHDRLAHQVGSIPLNERIVMFVAIGYSADGVMVPRSPRRDIGDLLIIHDNS